MVTEYPNLTVARTPCVGNGWNTTINSTVPACDSTTDQEKQQLKEILSILISAVLTLIMVGIGCAVEVEKVVKRFKNPTGIIIGLISQFVVMPILAYMWASIFYMDDPETLSLLIVGSCPGGTLSNVVTYWLRGDMELSVVMTTVSVTSALGMLPLLLFIYSQIFDNNIISVPFATIGITIALIIVPLSVGAFLNYKFPKLALKILRISGIVGIIALIIIAGMSIYTFSDFWQFHTRMIVTAICYPLCGMIIGYALSSVVSQIAKPLWLTHRQRRTVSIETGIQNGQLALTIVQLAGWSLETTGRVIVFPLMYTISQVIWCVIYIAFYHLIHYARNGRCAQLHERPENDNPEKSSDPISVIADNPAFEMNE